MINYEERRDSENHPGRLDDEQLSLVPPVLADGNGRLYATAGFGLRATAQTPPGVLLVGQIAEPKSLDPHAVTAANDFRILANLYDGLVRFADGTLTPWPKAGQSRMMG
jgi:ABC-type transport system substrate-binding protein